jgi:NAD+ synthase (glutamine-hydrolysing)
MAPGSAANNWFLLKGRRIQVTICEDIWGWDLPGRPSGYPKNPLLALPGPSPSLVVNLSASPFTAEKEKDRLAVIAKTARHFSAPLLYVNMAGGQDELVFDGGSLAVDATGKPFARCVRFAEDLNVVDIDELRGGLHASALPAIEALRQALVLGIRDFAQKNGMARAHLGLSGGIDSAVVACLAVDALGPSNVTCVTLPGPFNPDASRKLAQRLGKNLGARVLNAPISTTYEIALEAAHKAFGDFSFGIVNENLQSRIRGLFLMALANKENSLLLTTGNKCEYATGYATLYGDMCGGLAPIGDLVKADVYALSALYNSQAEVIPHEIVTREPSAELRPNQRDQDSLPPYAKLDRAVRALVEERRPARGPLEKWLLGRMAQAEFKRWQAPPIIKVTRHAFGRGRRWPIANRARG